MVVPTEIWSCQDTTPSPKNSLNKENAIFLLLLLLVIWGPEK
jgi:hypothetical protein